MALPLLSDFSTKTIISGTEIQNEHENIAAKFNGDIVDADVNANAALSLSKLAGRYQYQQVNLSIRTADLAAGWPGGAVAVAIAPLVGLSGTGVWTVKDIYWACQDIGAGTGTFRVGYGQLGGVITYLNTAQAIDAAEGVEVSSGSATITFGASPVSLQLISATGDATCLNGGNNWDSLTVSVNLRRDIQAA